MLVWCLSGVVMMFVRYPELTEAQRLGGLQPIDWKSCCRLANPGPLADSQPVSTAVVEDLGGRPVVRVQTSDGKGAVLDLLSGAPVGRIGARQALRVAETFLRSRATVFEKTLTLDVIERDQWTVSGEFNPDRPLYKVALGDRAGSEIYVSSSTGAAVQLTTGTGRFWNWLGAVPHWLYPTILRSNGALWTQVVVWTSLVGCFLTLTGLYIGVAMLKRQAGRWSPYRRVWLWHHLAGVGFGLLTLAWIASGLVSMNPWGFLESGPDAAEVRLQGAPPAWAAVRTALRRLAEHPPRGDLVSVSAEPLGGRLYLLGRTGDGGLVRLDPDGAPAPLTAAELAAAARRLASGRAVVSAAAQTGEDAYYFRHHGPALAPAYRVILRDGARYYLDARTGALLRAVDANARGYRWLHQGLHRWDFIPGLHDGPVWAILMLILLGGVTFGVGTGIYLGVGAVARDVRRLVRRVAGRG